MALDHYVSQVHLRKFYSPSFRNRMYAISKRNLRTFTASSEGVCGIHEGSTNSYLREARAIEAFLETIEPNYNTALEQLANDRIDEKCIYTIAGFAAYVSSCSPGAMRVNSSALQGMVQAEGMILESQGLLPAPPPELAGLNLTEIFNRGLVQVDVDLRFPQAIGIASILKNTALLGNFQWEVLHNNIEDSSYFTSDYPVAIEQSRDPSLRNKVIPLSPNLAIRIRPTRSIRHDQVDFTFANFSHKTKDLLRKEVEHVNRLVVRCAEDLVFFRNNEPWVQKFVGRNRHFRVDTRVHRVPHGTGIITECTQDIIETR